MSNHYGDFPTSGVVYMDFDSFAAATGAPSAVTNFASSDIQIYKDGGTTQRSSSAGITVATSFDSQTGLQMVAIDTSDNTDAGFYAAGHEYNVAVADITVDGQTLRFWLGAFSIERSGGALALLKAIKSGSGVNVTQWNGQAVTNDANNVPNVSTKYIGGTLQTPRDLGLSVLLAAGQKVDVDTIKTNPVVNAGTITFPSGATLASTTNITAGTITTVTNLTNAPTAGDFTATMKTSLNAATPSVTVSDKTGFSLVQTFPANFALLGITGAGKLTEVVTYTGNTPQTGDFFATAIAEAAAVPATNASAAAKLAWLAAMGLNPLKQTATTLKLRNNADGADIGTSTTSDDGTTATRGKFA